METIVDQILNHPGLDKGTGMTGTALGKIPGTDAYNMQQLLFTLKSKTSIQTLQAMRQASASGGALGQISNYEDQMLANSINNLDAGQSKTQFIQQIKAFKSYLDGLKTRLSDAYNQTYSPIGKSFKESTKPDNVPQDLWDIMTPEEKAAWQ